jgi:hypothetical protein
LLHYIQFNVVYHGRFLRAKTGKRMTRIVKKISAAPKARVKPLGYTSVKTKDGK